VITAVDIQRFVAIGNQDVRARGVKNLGAAPGDRLIVCDTNDEPFFPASSLGSITSVIAS